MGAAPPTGTVAFLFTDIQGSTSLWDADREAMAAAVARHDLIVRGTVEDRGGVIFATSGDGFSAAFGLADDAVDAGVAIQRSVTAESWPVPAVIAVRIGVHVGPADERDGDYFGPTVNRAARVCDAGHGGQIVVSGVTADLLTRHDTAALGEHRLRGVADPMSLFQVRAEGVRQECPPLRSETSAVSTLPVPRTSFIGRDEDVAAVVRLLDQHRLVTLTGAGGCGKTRLAIAAGGALQAAYPDGRFFVDLSRISDERQVAQSFADGIGFTSGSDEPVAHQLCDLLSTRRALLVVDNCEHLLDATAELVEELLASAPNLRVLATSREVLEVDGERPMRVRSLDTDEFGAAVALFCDRAIGNLPDPSPHDRSTIAEICRRLDGLPLAIELAAARTSLFSPDQLLERLGDRFRLLTAGRRRTRGRQQTLEAAIDWSYDLLQPDEQRALQCLAVMPGAFTLDLATAVLGIEEAVAIDLLDGLVARCLVQPTSWILGGAAYRLLETIRVYATAKLQSATDPEAPRRRHARHVAESLDQYLNAWRPELTALADDVIAAHEWAEATGDEDQQKLAVLRGLVHIVQQQDESALRVLEHTLDVAADPDITAMVHGYLAFAGGRRGEIGSPLEHINAAIAVAPESIGAAWAHLWRAYGLAPMGGDAFEDDVRELERRSEQLPSEWRQATCFLRGYRAHWTGDLTTAQSQYRVGLDRCVPGSDVNRCQLVTALLSAAATCTAPAEGIDWLRDNSQQLIVDPWMFVFPDGVATVAVAHLAVADVHTANGDRDAAAEAIDRFLEVRATCLMHYPLCDNDLAVTLALLAHFDGDAERAAELLTTAGRVTYARPAHQAVARLLVDGVPREDWSDRLAAQAWSPASNVDARARDRAVRASLVDLGITDR